MTAYTARALSTDRLQKIITQNAHGFDVGNVLTLSGGVYIGAQANNEPNAETVGIVSFVIDNNDFVITQAGYITGITPPLAVAGVYYYLDDTTPANLTVTIPTTVGHVIVPLLFADTTTSGWYFNNYGTLIESGPLFAWTIVGTNTTMVVNNGYMTSSGSLINLALPNTSVVGDMIRVVNIGASNFKITQPNSGTIVEFGNVATTLGTSGFIQSTNKGDSIEIVCTNTNAGWFVLNAMGNLTFN